MPGPKVPARPGFPRTALSRSEVTTRAKPSAKSGGAIHEEVPRPPDVTLGRLQMRDGQTQRNAFAHARVREKYLARLVHVLQQPFIRRVELAFRQPFASERIPPEAHH